MALAEIFFLDRASAQYESRDVDDLDALVQSVIPQTRSIPVRYLPECYVVALEQRSPNDNFQIRGVELLNAWKVIQGRIEMESKGAYDNRRALPSRARGACSRCFGTGFERMPNGSVRPGCAHEEWTPEDESELERNEEQVRADVARQAEVMREALKVIGGRKPPPVAEAKPVPVGHWLACDSCDNRVNVLYVTEGQKCGALLNRHEGDLKLCGGALNPV